MILLALLLSSIGLADIARPRRDRITVLLLLARSTAVAAAWLALCVWSMNIEWWWAVIGTVLTALWVWSTDAVLASRRSLPWPIVGFALVVVTTLALGSNAPQARGTALDWYGSLALVSLDSVSFELFALAVGCLLYLLESANVTVRIVLTGAVAHHGRTNKEDGVQNDAPQKDLLKGGRILGPIERVFIFAMALAGQLLAITAIVAAKSILRYPEVSKDKDSDGSKAEYVLVGSFVSWSLALIFVPLLWNGAA